MATSSRVISDSSPEVKILHSRTGGPSAPKSIVAESAHSAGKAPSTGVIPPTDLEEECVICLDKPESFRGKLPSCDHIFCFDCIKKWSGHENTCPLCKRRFTKINKVATSAGVASSATSSKGKGKRKRGAGGTGEGSVKVKQRSQSQGYLSNSGPSIPHHLASMMGGSFEAHDLSSLIELGLMTSLASRPNLAGLLSHSHARNFQARRDEHLRARQEQQQHALHSRRNQPGESGFSVDNPEVIADSDDDDDVQIIDPPSSSSSSSSSSGSSSSALNSSSTSGASAHSSSSQSSSASSQSPAGLVDYMPTSRAFFEDLMEMGFGDVDSDSDSDDGW